MSKLIIHETDSHGCGTLHYNGITHNYSYDDSRCGDIMLAVNFLIEIGFIKSEDVLLFFDCGREPSDDIYYYLNNLIEATEK